MGLKFLTARQAVPAERRNGPQPVIDSNSLREAALRASWYRDHRVAGRREAWRWVMFWGWTYGRKAGILVVPMVIASYLAFQFWPGTFTPQAAPGQISPVHGMPASVVATPAVEPTNMQPAETPMGIRLEPAVDLRTGTPGRSTNPVDPSTQSPFQPLRLTPEIQTSPKELSP